MKEWIIYLNVSVHWIILPTGWKTSFPEVFVLLFQRTAFFRPVNQIFLTCSPVIHLLLNPIPFYVFYLHFAKVQHRVNTQKASFGRKVLDSLHVWNIFVCWLENSRFSMFLLELLKHCSNVAYLLYG